jgi:hypothetical protein
MGPPDGILGLVEAFGKDDFPNDSTHLTVTAAESEASVGLPLELLDLFGDDLVLVFAVFKEAPQFTDLGGTGEDQMTLNSALDINIASAATRLFQNVSNLTEPIVLTFPATRSSGAKCAYWDEEAQQWSTSGLATLDNDDSEGLVCNTVHLSFFAALTSGFIKPIDCTPLRGLFSKDAYAEIWKGTWWQEAPAILFFLILKCLFSILLCSIASDLRRSRSKSPEEFAWRDEFFLICPEMGITPSEMHRAEVEPSFCKQVLTAFTDIRDAVEEVIMNYMGAFRFVRSFLEGLWQNSMLLLAELREELKDAPDEAKDSFTLTVLAGMLHQNARRLASAAFKLRVDDATYLLDHELHDLESGDSIGQANSDHDVVKIRSSTHQRSVLSKMSVDVKRHIDEEVAEHRTWRTFPSMAWRDFANSAPLSQIFLRSIFITSSKRALIFISHILGACTMCTAFLSVSSFTHGRSVRPDAQCEPMGFWEVIGSMVTITLGAAFVASLPATLLQSLHRRCFTHVPYIGCPEWNRQLRTWRIQDVIFWIVGLAYVALCVLFNVIFFANVSPADLEAWLADIALEFLEIVLLIPLTVSVARLFFLMLFLAILARRQGINKEELVNRVQDAKDTTSNRTQSEAGSESQETTEAAIDLTCVSV